MSDKSIICASCRIQFPSVEIYKDHILAPFHIYNVNRRMAKLDPISEEVFNVKKSRKFPFISLILSDLADAQ